MTTLSDLIARLEAMIRHADLSPRWKRFYAKHIQDCEKQIAALRARGAAR